MGSAEEIDLRRRLDSVTSELLGTYEEIEVLTTVAEIAASNADVAAVGRRILDEASALLQADVAFIIYSDPELKGEEPAPAGITGQERDALGAVLAGGLSNQPRPVVMSPFLEGAGIPHAPDALLAVPLRSEGLTLGAICLGKRGEGVTFTAGDQKILSVLGSSAASALLQRKNLDLVRLTRGLEHRNQLLKGILSISREIASTLDLDRLLHALANLPTRVLGFDRCAVALDDGGRRRLRAVSGIGKVDRGDAEMKSLESLLDWAAVRGTRIIVSEEADGSGETEGALTAEPPEAAVQAAAHMKLAGARSLLVIPLSDDQGLLGVISFESGTAGFVDERHLEGAAILANQATVALRNAQLYAEVPLMGFLKPLRAGLARAGNLPRRRLAGWSVLGLAILAILVFGQWNLKVPGIVTVLPSRVEANDLTLRLNEASAREESALRSMTRLEAQGRAADLSLTRVERERWRNERVFLAQRIEEASLRAPIDGVLLTPRMEERVGELLEIGGVLCTLAQTDHLRVEIAVAEHTPAMSPLQSRESVS